MTLALASLTALLSCLPVLVAPAGAQERPVRTFDEFRVTVGPEERNDGTWFRVDFTNGQAREFLVQDVFDPIRLARDLTQYQGRLLILRSGKASVVIVDPVAGTVIDRFLALREEPSPDGRYLALERWTPNGVEYVDPVFSVYDLQRPPEHNGPRQARDSFAGWIVYPPRNAARQKYYSLAKDAADAHDLLSPLTWLAPHLLALVDHHQGAVRLVTVDVAAGIDRARIAENALNVAELLTAKAPHNAPRMMTIKAIEVVGIADGSTALRLIFEPWWFLRKHEVVLRIRHP